MNRMCPLSFAEFSGQANEINFYNQPTYDDPYHEWSSHSNFSWNIDPKKLSLEETMQNFIQATQTQFQNIDSRFQLTKPTLEETLQSFIQVTQTLSRNAEIRFQNTESSFQNMQVTMKKIEAHLDRITEAVQSHTYRKLSSQPEQVKTISTLGGAKVIDDKVGDMVNNSNVFAVDEEEMNAWKDAFPILNSPFNNKPPPPYDSLIPCPGHLELNKVVEKPHKGNEQFLAVDVLPQEKVGELIENLNEGSAKKDTKEKSELEQLPHSFRYACVGNELCFLVMLSSSFTGMEQDTFMPFQDPLVKFDVFKGMEQFNEKKNCLKIYGADGVTEESSRETINSIEGDSSEEIASFDNVLGALLFSKLLPSFKEPEHRKAKFQIYEGGIRLAQTLNKALLGRQPKFLHFPCFLRIQFG